MIDLELYADEVLRNIFDIKNKEITIEKLDDLLKFCLQIMGSTLISISKMLEMSDEHYLSMIQDVTIHLVEQIMDRNSTSITQIKKESIQ